MAAIALPRPLTPVTLIRRVNRFAVEVRAVGTHRRLYLHLPNSGRMSELLRTGVRGMAHLAPRPGGRTRGTLVIVRHRGRWVGVDARVPNRLFEAGLRMGTLVPFDGYRVWRREVRFRGGRVDFTLEGAEGTCLVETKSCNRVEDGVALFPDAPTTRGARHLVALSRAAREGRRAAVVWFVQRDDTHVLRADETADPVFAAAARDAAAAGVELYAYACRVTPGRVAVLRPIPVETGKEVQGEPRPAVRGGRRRTVPRPATGTAETATVVPQDREAVVPGLAVAVKRSMTAARVRRAARPARP
ncbi:MAG: DNA/RNA nuclease SfsA [Armatimonadetes bacterium]|nr:DNA/RNA nuclease SfsA [Armatimonadota bacterium]